MHNLPPSTLEQELQRRIESDVENAVRVLTHYLTQGWSQELKAQSLHDARAEVRDIVEAIISATVLTVQKNKIDLVIASRALPNTQPPMELLHGGTHHDEDDDPIAENNAEWEEARGREGSRSLPENFRREIEDKL